MQIYRNGQAVGAPLAYDGTINTNVAIPAMSIGAKILTNNLPDGGSPGYWHGKMDELGLWTRGLTAAEIGAIYRAGCGAFSLAEADVNALPPVLTQNPPSQTNYIGNATMLTAAATAAGTVHYSWLFNGAVIPGANSATLPLPNLQLGHAGDYRVVAASIGGCVTGAVATLTVLPNAAPVAANSDAATPQNTALAIMKAKMLTDCTDADGDVLTIISAGPTSTNGAAVTMNATHVVYTPQTGFVGTDRFNYTVSDGKGGLATASVIVGVYIAGEGFNRVTFSVSGGQVHLGYAGIPQYTYSIQRTATLSPPAWVTIGTSTADASGHVSFTDANPPAGSAFYRTMYP
jgi:hypothetical protein